MILQMWSGLPRNFYTSAHIGGQVLTSEGQTCSLGRTFTTLICQPEGSEETIRLPVQGITKAELMGELAGLQALPIYQLALPFSLAAWRQLEYAHNLTGTTL